MKTNFHAPLKGAISILTALALPASAARLAYEGFEYTEADGTALSALASPTGTGWDGNFGSTSTNTTTPVNLQAGLSYTGFTSAPASKAMRFAAGSVTVYRPWSGTYATPDTITDGTYWYSFLYRPAAASRGGTLCAFGKPTDPQNGFGMRMDRGDTVTPAFPATSIRFQAWGNNGGGGTLEIPNGYDKTYFILGKCVFNSAGNSTNTLWIYTDPAALPTTEPTTGGITHTIAFNAPYNSELGTNAFRTVMSGRSFSTANTLDYDEFRVANTFAEVFPAPAGSTEFSLDPITAVQGQVLTFAWTNVPAGSNPTLNGNAVTIDGSGNGGTTLLAPATNTTYTLAWTGAGSPLTRDFTAVAPSFTLTPSTGYLGDTMTLNWRVPVSTLPGITAVTLTPVPGGVPVDLGGFTSATTGIGSTTLPAPTATTVYTLSYTYNGNPFTLPTQTYTLLPSFVTVAPPQPITDYTDLKITWRIPPEWDDNTTAPNTVLLRYGSPADFLAVPPAYTESELTAKTAPLTGAGSNVKPDNTTDPEIVPGAGQTEYRLVFNVGNVEQVLSANVTLRPKIISIDDVVNNKKPVEIDDYPLLDGVFAYSDRGHAWANIPTILQGAQFIKLANDDKVTAVSDPPVDPPPHFNITFSAVQSSTFFLLLDNRIGDGNGTNPPTLGNGVMDWVLISGFVDTGLDIGLDESAATQPGVDQTYSVFFKQVNLGDSFTFQQQNDGGARNMYGIAAVSPQIVPVSFAASPTTLNEGQSTTLQWTVPVGATASIDQGIGPVSVDGVGVGSTIVFPTTTTTYKLTYVLGANPPVELAPVTVTVNATTSPFALWMSTNFPAITAPNNAADVDADGDGVSNFGEFAFSGNPGSGSDDGLTRSAIDNISGTNHLTLTFACRTGATFTGAGPATASKDGADYTVRASTDLSAFNVGVDEITPAITTGLPDPAPAGYSYRTFRVTAAQSANAKAFMQAIAAPTP